MASITSWIDRKLFLKVNASKSRVGRPMKIKYLGFTFIKYDRDWKVKPTDEKKAKLYKIITVVSSLVILLISPVEDSNKPLDHVEKRIFKKRTNIVLSVLVGIALFFLFKGGNRISICIIMGICLISVMLVLGKLKISKNKYQ